MRTAPPIDLPSLSSLWHQTQEGNGFTGSRVRQGRELCREGAITKRRLERCCWSLLRKRILLHNKCSSPPAGRHGSFRRRQSASIFDVDFVAQNKCFCSGHLRPIGEAKYHWWRQAITLIERGAGSSWSDRDASPCSRNHGLITGWRILGILSNTMENMVGTRRLELLTSTVSR